MEDSNKEYGKEDDEFKILSIVEDNMKEDEEVSALIGEYAVKYICKELRKTSEQTSHSWVQEILQGYPIRCYEMFRMEKHIFCQFCTELVEHGLKNTERMGVEGMTAMFLNMVDHGVSNRVIQERFQHSGEIVSRHFHKVLVVCLRLSFKYIKPLDPTF